VFVKGIGANWLVNVAIYMQLTSRSAGGKIAALWLPITTFVALGLEHAVANMFLIPFGMLVGATELHGVGVYDLLAGNMLPCVLGNFVGATVFMSFLPWYTDWYPNVRARRSDGGPPADDPNHDGGTGGNGGTAGGDYQPRRQARQEREASQASKLWHGKYPRYSEALRAGAPRNGGTPPE